MLAQGLPKVDRSDEPIGRVFMNARTVGYHRCRCKVVTRSTRENDDLKDVSLLVEQRAEPIHTAIIALDQLVVQNECRLQIFRQRQPIQCRQLFPRADG